MKAEFNLIDEGNLVLVDCSKTGMETIYFNGNEVAKKRSLFGGSTHPWDISGNKYQIKISKMGKSVELFKNSALVDQIKLAKLSEVFDGPHHSSRYVNEHLNPQDSEASAAGTGAVEGAQTPQGWDEEGAVFFESGLHSKRKVGSRYGIVASSQGVSFTCLTAENSGRPPSEKESLQFNFDLRWDRIAEVKKPATMFDKVVTFVEKDGSKTQAIFENDGDEIAVYRALKQSYGEIPGVRFTFEKTPAWKLLIIPIGFSVLMVGIGIGLYFLFDNLEREGGRIRINVIIAFFYQLLGKNGILIVFCLLALIGIPWAMRKLQRYRSLSQ